MKHAAWIRMKKQIESLWAPSLQGVMSIDMTNFASKECASARFIITLRGEKFWDWPLDYYITRTGGGNTGLPPRVIEPPRGRGIDKRWEGDSGDVTGVIGHYLDTPITDLFEPMMMPYSYHPKHVHKLRNIDAWDLGDILRAADRRIGFDRLTWWCFFQMDPGSPGRAVLGARFRDKKGMRLGGV